MTFWDPDTEINLVNNKPQDKRLHDTEARSAFGSTDFPSRQTSSNSDGIISSTTSSPRTAPGAATPQSEAISPTSLVVCDAVTTTKKTVAAAAAAAATTLCSSGDISDRAQALRAHQASVPPLPVPELQETLDLYMKSLEGLVSAESWQRTKDTVETFLQAPSSPLPSALSSTSTSTGDAIHQQQQQQQQQKQVSVAERLQSMLKEHAAASRPNWLETFWDDMYLYGRDPIPINVNYCFGLSASPAMDAKSSHDQVQETQINRASCLIHAMASIYNEIRVGKWALDFERKSPQCMSQYRRVFCASRIPGEHRDSILTYLAGSGEQQQQHHQCRAVDLSQDEIESQTSSYETLSSPTRHIVVVIRNRYFAVDVLAEQHHNDEGSVSSAIPGVEASYLKRFCDGGLCVLPVEEIAKRLALACALANLEGSNAGAPVGVLTTMSRTDWWRAREELKELGNGDILHKIQSAIWLVALDSLETSDSQERARIFLHGPGTNRWFDRHTLIVTRNGDAGINFEHSIGDGATTLRIADEMHRRERNLHSRNSALSAERVKEIVSDAYAAVHGQNKTATMSSTTTIASEAVQELRWKLDGQIDYLMRGAYTQYVELIQSNETTTLDFTRFGGDYIKKSGNSPDAFVQLAFQLTHHRLFGKPTATYEAASTRTFSHGRTEVLRSCTRAATDFCQMSGEPIFSHRVNSAIPPQLTLLRNATEAHVQYMKRAKEGCGVDRHLLGLRLMAAKAGIPTPAIFTDENFKLSSHWAMSTSHCGSSALTLFGFGPVVPDGFGLGYMIKNDCISVTITSKYTHRYHSSKVFATMLESSLLQMQAIVDADWESRLKARPKAMEFSHPTTYNDIEFEPTRGFIYSQKPKRSLYDLQHSSSSMSANASFAPEVTY